MKTYRKLLQWHKRIGITAALFVIILALTGIALNHTDQFEFDQKFIDSSFLLDWYNISPPEKPVSYATENVRLSQLGERLYFNEQELQEQTDHLMGAIQFKDSVVVAITGSLLVFDYQGQLIEKLTSADGVPSGMKRIGRSVDNLLVVEAAHGEYLADLEEFDWDEKISTGTRWSDKSLLPETLKLTLFKAYRGKGLSVERVLLDLHSGRILGDFGVILIDVAAILFIILAVTGVWMWSRSRQ